MGKTGKHAQDNDEDGSWSKPVPEEDRTNDDGKHDAGEQDDDERDDNNQDDEVQ
jgi:hypothetical protein